MLNVYTELSKLVVNVCLIISPFKDGVHSEILYWYIQGMYIYSVVKPSSQDVNPLSPIGYKVFFFNFLSANQWAAAGRRWRTTWSTRGTRLSDSSPTLCICLSSEQSTLTASATPARSLSLLGRRVSLTRTHACAQNRTARIYLFCNPSILFYSYFNSNILSLLFFFFFFLSESFYLYRPSLTTALNVQKQKTFGQGQ